MPLEFGAVDKTSEHLYVGRNPSRAHADAELTLRLEKYNITEIVGYSWIHWCLATANRPIITSSP